MNLEGQGSGGKACVRARVLQVRVSENHQNGKDTHVRGIQVFAKDERVKAPPAPHPPTASAEEEEDDDDDDGELSIKVSGNKGEVSRAVKTAKRLYVGEEPDWMGDPEIR